MKNTTLLGIFVIVLVIVGGFMFFNSGKNVNGNIVSDPVSEDAQKVILSIKNYNYYPNTITVESGKPVEITLDKSVGGCYRSFNVKDLGISQYARTPEDKIVFTPNKKGTFAFACSMGMGYGKLIVE